MVSENDVGNPFIMGEHLATYRLIIWVKIYWRRKKNTINIVLFQNPADSYTHFFFDLPSAKWSSYPHQPPSKKHSNRNKADTIFFTIIIVIFIFDFIETSILNCCFQSNHIQFHLYIYNMKTTKIEYILFYVGIFLSIYFLGCDDDSHLKLNLKEN